MTITRWDPFRELENMNERLNRVFGRSPLLSNTARESLANTDWAPAVDVAETNEEYLVKAELPDVRKDDVKVSLEGGTLRIAGERKEEKEEKNKRYHRVERVHGSFLRTFALPDDVDQAKLSADFKDGLLTVHLPKSAPSKQAAVDIKVS